MTRSSSDTGKIPVKAAEKLANEYDCPIVLIFAIHDNGDKFCVTTYGKSKALCRHAASLGKQFSEGIVRRLAFERDHLRDENADLRRRVAELEEAVTHYELTHGRDEG